MSKHNFMESSDEFGKYHRIIYCKWCGVVVWDFNYAADSVAVLQRDHAERPCKATKEHSNER